MSDAPHRERESESGRLEVLPGGEGGEVRAGDSRRSELRERRATRRERERARPRWIAAGRLWPRKERATRRDGAGSAQSGRKAQRDRADCAERADRPERAEQREEEMWGSTGFMEHGDYG